MSEKKRLMTEEELFEYCNKHLHYSKKVKPEQVQKIIKLFERFGYEYSGGFSRYSRDRGKKVDTSWYYKKHITEHDFIEIQIGTTKFGDAVFNYTKPDLNPEGKPWKIGDVKTVEGGRMAVKTRYGWNTGD